MPLTPNQYRVLPGEITPENAGDPNNPYNRRIASLYATQGGTNDSAADMLSGVRGSSLAESVSGEPNFQDFGLKIADMLRRYQKPFVEQGFNAQEEQVRRLSARPSDDLIGASPTLQSGVRSAEAGALDPTIRGADLGGKTISGYLDQVKDIVQTYQAQQKETATRAQQVINGLITSKSGDGILALVEAQPDVVKMAGYDTKTLQAIANSFKEQASQPDIDFQKLEDAYGNQYVVAYDKKTGKRVGTSGAGRVPASSVPSSGVTGGYVAPTGGVGSKSYPGKVDGTPPPQPIIPMKPKDKLAYLNQVEDNLRVNPAIKAFGELVNFGVPTVIDRFNKGQTDSVADTVLMRSLAKVTDPTTGVREEEYRTFEDAVGSLNRIRVIPQKWIGKGRLTTEGRSQMIREIADRFNSRLIDYNEQYGYYAAQAARVGGTIPPPYKVSVPIQSPASGKSGTTSSGLRYTIEP